MKREVRLSGNCFGRNVLSISSRHSFFFSLFLFFSCSSLEELSVSFCFSAFSIKNLSCKCVYLVLSHASNLDSGQHMHAVTH
jgi:hypothetical protein